MIENIERELAQCQIADEHRLRRQFKQLTKQGARKNSGKLAQLQNELSKSQSQCQRRDDAIPDRIEFPEQLPVSQKAEEIGRLLQENQVLVVAGDTGSGKTTQLPKICLQAGFGRRGLVGHTQPRRLAATSVANRIAEELGTEPGQGVGYQVRFNEKLAANSYLKVMTDGILLAEIQQDRFLNRYEVIIIDEAHERSLNIDFLLGFLKQLLKRRRDLKLIITSATIDVEKFSGHFDQAPIVKVSGRTFPVDVRYAPLENQRDALASDVQADAVVEQVKEILRDKKGGGDILVFLSGEREIRETAQALRKQRLPQLEILPLYARLRHSEQSKIFKPHQGVRVVLATNVAETSLTVPGINYVIDTGLARISRYSLQSKVQRLPIEPVSQASANQRKGRCGRLANGICIRLYSEQDFESRPEFTDPEIKRTNLAAVILRMKHLRLGEPDDFPFVEPPQGSAINEGLKLLKELDALDASGQLTDTGRQMAMLPVDPRLGRMLIVAAKEHCLAELLVIVSALSIQDPRESGTENRQQAREKFAEFEHQDSDFLSFNNLWLDYEQRRQDLTQNQLRKFCKTHFLSFVRMREWREVHRQLLLSCQHLNMRINRQPGSYEQVHRSIISGSLNQVAYRQEGSLFQGSRNRKFSLFPTSVLSNKNAKWIVTGELIETAQTFATMAARIQPEWVESMALHLVKREHYQPHWSKKRQEVVAYEKVQLYGLTLTEKNIVSFSRLDAEASHEIFIREALANDGIVTNARFYQDNKKLLAELARQEEKIRRPEFIVSERDVVRFYEERLPEDICSTQALAQWLKQEGKQGNARLTMDKASLLGKKEADDQGAAFPDRAAMQNNALKIDYQFSPGSQRDGASIEVPEALIGQMTQADIDWAVPGIMREKCIALIKGLPKSVRKNFIPVSGFVDEALPRMSSQDGDLLAALLSQIRQLKRVELTRDDFADVEIPGHLKTKIKLVDEQGKEVRLSDKLEDLRESSVQVSQPTAQAPGSFGHDIEMDGLQDFPEQEIPAQLTVGDELVLLRYPALVDEQDSVAVRLFADEVEAARSNEQGLLRLYMLKSVQQRNMLGKQFARLLKKHALVLPAPLKDCEDDAVLAVYRSAFHTTEQVPRTKAAFDTSLQQGKSQLHGIGMKLEAMLAKVIPQQWEIRRELADYEGSDLDYLRKDIFFQMEELLGKGFLTETAFEWLMEYPRFFNAIMTRLEKAPHLGPKDLPQTEELRNLWQRYERKREQLGLRAGPRLQQLRWLLEEYRVSLFAQKLGTRIPVSAKRLEKNFDSLERDGIQ